MSIKLVGGADLHLVDPNHRNYEEALKRLGDYVDTMISEDADAGYIAGDLFHNGRPHPETVARCKEHFSRLGKHQKMIISGGNHDHTGISSTFRNPIDAYLRDQPWCLETVDAKAKSVEYNGFKFGVVPWLRVAGSSQLEDTEAALREMIEDVANELEGGPSLLFGHIALEEASFSSGRRGSELSMATTMLEPHVGVQFLDSLPVSLWRLGHIHKRQNMGDNGGGYIGSSYKTTYGERLEAKGFDIVNIDDDGNASVEFHEIRVRELEQINLRDNPLGLRDLSRTLQPGDMVRALVENGTDLTSEQSMEVDELRKMGILVEFRHLPKEVAVHRKIKNATVETTPMDAMKQYVQAHDLENGRDKEILGLFADIYEENRGSIAS